MKRKPLTAGKGNRDNESMKRWFSILLLVLIFFTISAGVAEAAALDKVKTAWGKVRVYVLAPAFWVNALLIFGVLFVVYSLLLAEKMGSDTSQKVIIYLLIAIIAMVIATKIVASNGVPQYMWKNTQFERFTQFLIGPSNPKGACGSEAAYSQVKAIFAWDPNPICCGNGAYDTVERGKPVCRQALLRTNENGSGLPALIVSFLIFFLLFRAFGDKLGFGDTGGGGGKWLPIILSLVLAALITNQRVTKNTIITISGWVAVILIGRKMSGSFSEGDQEQGHWKKIFAFGLAVAAVELAANLLGGSLAGGSFTSGDISFGRILGCILFGLPFGFIFTTLTTDNLWGRMWNNVNRERREDVTTHLNNGDYGLATGRNMPIVGGMVDGLRPQQEQQGNAQAMQVINDQLTQAWQTYNNLLQTQPNNHIALQQLTAHINDLTQQLQNLIAAGNVPPGQAPPQPQPPPQAPPEPQAPQVIDN